MGSTLVTERLIACWWISLFWERNFSDNWFVWLIKKDMCLLENWFWLQSLAMWGERKKRHQKILFTLQLTSKFTWTKIMVSVDGLVISQIAGGLSISQCLLSVTFLQLDQVKFSFVRKAYRAMNCYSRTKPERFKYQQNEFFLVKILYHFNFHWYGIQSLFAKLFQIDLSR